MAGRHLNLGSDDVRRRSPAAALVAALALAACCWLASSAADADQDPRWRWRTLETDHFRVHYYEGLERVARRIAATAERRHADLTEALGWRPRRITHLVVLDDTDYAQGITYVGAQNLIRLWVVAPDDESNLEDYDDWLDLLVTHEYTHLVHIDQARGLPTIINAIFGRIYHPLQFVPAWLTEGYAVHEESARTTGGRVRSTRFDMYLRMDVLEDRFLRIDQVSSGTRDWPQGNVPYLYGQDFVNYLARRFGEEALAELAREMSDDLIPYGINRAFRRTTRRMAQRRADAAFREATGHTLIELWEDWRRSLELGYRAVAERVRARGLTSSRRLTSHGQRTGPPRFGPDGRTLYFYSSSEESPAAIWSLDVESEELERVELVPGSAPVVPSPDGRFLYYVRGDRHQITYQYRDIFRLDLRTGVEERLTDGARATSVDVSPDGRRIVYAANRQSSSDLWLADRDGGQARRLIESPPGGQVSTPRFSPDGRHVAIGRWSRGGMRDIQIIDIEDGTVREITHDRALDSSPCFSPDGRWLLFSSDRTGIANLYAYDLEHDRLRQVTNVLSGAYMPDVSSDGERLAFIGYSTDGYDVHLMRFDPDELRDPEPTRDRGGPHDDPPPRPARMRDRRYSPWATLAPRSWLLGLGQDSFGQALTFTTNAQDASARHAFAGALTLGLERGDVSYDLTYEYRRFRPNISIRHSRWVAPRTTFRLDTVPVGYIEETILGGIDVSIFLSRGNSSHRLWGGWELRYTRSTTELRDQDFDPGGRPPRFPSVGLRSGVRFGWSYSSSRASVRAISPEQGRAISTSVSLYHPALGSDFFQVTFRYRWTEYIPMPWRHHHVLALSLGGGISAGDLLATPFYIGGYPEQDVVGALINQSFLGGNYLRGYPPGVIGGMQYHLLNVEYRFPVWSPERGLSTLPLALSHLWLAAFCDVGGAFARNLDVDELLVGAGAELVIRIVIGYQLPLTLRVGYAYGFMEDGDHQVFANFGLPF